MDNLIPVMPKGNSLLQAVILCGGMGTRISKISKDVPKSLIQISKDLCFIDILINFLKENYFHEVILCVGFRQDQIIDHIKKNYSNVISFKFSKEKELLGTGGAVKNALSLIKDEFLLMNGDSFVEFDLHSFVKNHHKNANHVSILLKKMENSSRYGSVMIDNKNLITSFQEKKQVNNSLINLGIYLISKSKINWYEYPDVFSFEKDFLPKICKKNSVGGFLTDGYFIDIGIPEDLIKFREDMKKGIINRHGNPVI